MQDEYGHTALMYAAKNDPDENRIVELLLEAGARAHVNHQDKDGFTALNYAVINYNEDGVRQLLAAGAHVNTHDNYGLTPLMRAIFINKKKTVHLLLENMKKTDGNHQDKASEADLIYAILQNNNQMVLQLFAAGAAINKDGYTALMYAAFCGKKEIVRQLLAAGADINTQNKYGYTSLMHAASCGKNAVVRLLLAAGADINARNHKGETALELAESNVVIHLLLTATTNAL